MANVQKIIVCAREEYIDPDEGLPALGNPVCDGLLDQAATIRWADVSNVVGQVENMHIFAVNVPEENLAALEARSDVHVVDEGRLGQWNYGRIVAFLNSQGINRAKYAAARATFNMERAESALRNLGMQVMAPALRKAVVDVEDEL